MNTLLTRLRTRLRPRCLALALPLLLGGCLEVDQFPGWVHGEYAGKEDQRHYQARFHGDRLAWSAKVQNRAMQQNEYNRANP